ncbi:hypothetical protein DFAR_620003 [Desulfarculales bacterium]
MRRARSGHRQLLQGHSHQTHQRTGPGGRPGPQEETRLHHRGSIPPQVSSPGRVAHHHSVSGRLQANPVQHPGRLEQPRRPPYIQNSLLLAPRVVARSHLAGVSLQDMQAYLLHHLKIVSVKRNLFLIWPSPPYSRAPAASPEGLTTWPEARS